MYKSAVDCPLSRGDIVVEDGKRFMWSDKFMSFNLESEFGGQSRDMVDKHLMITTMWRCS